MDIDVDPDGFIENRKERIIKNSRNIATALHFPLSPKRPHKNRWIDDI